jgi:hypothetical protein
VDAASSEDISNLGGFDRALVLLKSQLPNLKRLLACNPSADCAPAVLAVITVLSDNPEGYATVSIDTLAALLGRRSDNIRAARQRCVEAGVLIVEDRPGNASRSWPVIFPAQLEDPKASVAWFLDALAGQRAARGRPRTKNPLTPFSKPPLPSCSENPSPQGGRQH